MAREFQFKKGNGKEIINATQQLHNSVRISGFSWHNPVLKPAAATGTAV